MPKSSNLKGLLTLFFTILLFKPHAGLKICRLGTIDHLSKLEYFSESFHRGLDYIKYILRYSFIVSMQQSWIANAYNFINSLFQNKGGLLEAIVDHAPRFLTLFLDIIFATSYLQGLREALGSSWSDLIMKPSVHLGVLGGCFALSLVFLKLLSLIVERFKIILEKYIETSKEYTPFAIRFLQNISSTNYISITALVFSISDLLLKVQHYRAYGCTAALTLTAYSVIRFMVNLLPLNNYINYIRGNRGEDAQIFKILEPIILCLQKVELFQRYYYSAYRYIIHAKPLEQIQDELPWPLTVVSKKTTEVYKEIGEKIKDSLDYWFKTTVKEVHEGFKKYILGPSLTLEGVLLGLLCLVVVVDFIQNNISQLVQMSELFISSIQTHILKIKTPQQLQESYVKFWVQKASANNGENDLHKLETTVLVNGFRIITFIFLICSSTTTAFFYGPGCASEP